MVDVAAFVEKEAWKVTAGESLWVDGVPYLVKIVEAGKPFKSSIRFRLSRHEPVAVNRFSTVKVTR